MKAKTKTAKRKKKKHYQEKQGQETMRFESVLDSSKWHILSAIANGATTPSEVAKATRTSLPNVSQQAKVLEALNLIATTTGSATQPGRPGLRYQLGKELAYIAMARKGFAGTKTVPLDAFHTAILNTWFLERPEDHYVLFQFLLQHEDHLKACSVGVSDARGDEIHLLIIAPGEKLEKLREKLSRTSISVQNAERQRHVICWTHSRAEVIEGLRRGDPYYKNLVRALHVIIERDDVFRACKGEEEHEVVA